MLCANCKECPVDIDPGVCRKCSGMKTESTMYMYCPKCSEVLGMCECCGHELSKEEHPHSAGTGMAEERLELAGSFKHEVDQWFKYVLWFDTPLGWTGDPAGSFVLTEEYESGDSGSGSKGYNGRWELRRSVDGYLVDLFPETVEEAFWDLDMHGGEDQEMRYKYEGPSPLTARVEELKDGVILKLCMPFGGRELVLTKEEEE